MGALRTQQIRKVFGSNEVLKSVDLEVKSGEFVILVGPSGCGKSTLLNIIAGLDAPTDGRVFINERDVTYAKPKDRDIAMVFQSYALYPTMTVARNISFGLEMRGIDKAKRDEAVARVAKTLHIEHLLDRKPSQLSGGQRQRVAMGRALARDPALFLFDEPLSNLDAKLRVEMRAEIKVMHQRSDITTVYVTHDQVEAMTLGDRIAVMRDGEIQQLAAPDEIYGRPANRFVAEFIGSPAMNIIEAKRIDHAGIVAAGISLPLTSPQQAALHTARTDDLIYGVRPEALHFVPESEQLLSARVRLVEPTGPETFAFLDSPVGALMCRVPGKTALQLGDSVGVRWHGEDAHVFDAKTEQRLA